MMKELLSSVADKYIVSNISMFSNNNKIYIYDNYGNAREIGVCGFNDAAQQIAYYCLDNDIEFVQLYGNKMFLAPVAKMITKEVDKQSLSFANKDLKVKVAVG